MSTGPFPPISSNTHRARRTNLQQASSSLQDLAGERQLVPEFSFLTFAFHNSLILSSLALRPQPCSLFPGYCSQVHGSSAINAGK
jgi:hypothetical protein